MNVFCNENLVYYILFWHIRILKSSAEKMWSILPNWASHHHSKIKSFFVALWCLWLLEVMIVGTMEWWECHQNGQEWVKFRCIFSRKHKEKHWPTGSCDRKELKEPYIRGGKTTHSKRRQKELNSMLLTLSSKGRKRRWRRLGSCLRKNALNWRTSGSLSVWMFSMFPLTPFPYAEQQPYSFSLFRPLLFYPACLYSSAVLLRVTAVMSSAVCGQRLLVFLVKAQITPRSAGPLSFSLPLIAPHW